MRWKTEETKERIEKTKERQHRWIYIRLGRVCENCYAAQATGDFDDEITCR